MIDDDQSQEGRAAGQADCFGAQDYTEWDAGEPEELGVLLSVCGGRGGGGGAAEGEALSYHGVQNRGPFPYFNSSKHPGMVEGEPGTYDQDAVEVVCSLFGRRIDQSKRTDQTVPINLVFDID